MAIVVCGVVLTVSAVLSWSAVSTKNATMDEPAHLLSGLAAVRQGDFRLETTTPPLWKLWAALGTAGVPVTLTHDGPFWRDPSGGDDAEAAWNVRALYDTPGNDADRLVRRGRAMMLVIALGLGAVVAAFAYQLAGPVAAVVAVWFFALDPTVLAHGPIIKSDVPLAAALAGLAWAAWRFGRRATVAGGAAVGLLCAAAVNVKFSGLLVGPVVAVLLATRAVLPWDWALPAGRVARTRVGRLAVAGSTGVFAAVACFVMTWACYGFRYRPAPSPAARLDLAAVTADYRFNRASAPLYRRATPAEVAACPVSALDRFVHWADDHHALPQAMLVGLLRQSTNACCWPAFLDGRVYEDGRLAYFPLAVLYKTPLPTLAAIAVAVLAFPLRRRIRLTGLPAADGGDCRLKPAARSYGTVWAAACLAIPAGGFAAAAVGTHVNIGLRSLLPAYPFVAVSLGCTAAWAWRHRPRATAAVLAPLMAALLVSVAAAWPDYLPFFNGAVGDPRGGFAHLADSNLDWGQDVTALADWHRAHPAVPIYADLFTAVDPAYYGLDARPLYTHDAAGLPHLNGPTAGPAVLAVSATHLRGLYIHEARLALLKDLARRPPLGVLHGTIYLYQADPTRDEMGRSGTGPVAGIRPDPGATASGADR